MTQWIVDIAVLLAAVILLIRAKRVSKLATLNKDASDSQSSSKAKKKNPAKWMRIIGILLLWLGVSMFLNLVFGPRNEELEVSIFVDYFNIGGIKISQSAVYSWGIIAVVAVLGLLFRFLVVPKFQDIPSGWQNILETCVEAVQKYVVSTSEVKSPALGAYMFAMALYMIGCAAIEIFGVRSPTSDIIVTGAMAITIFVLINYYGIKKKGVGGRLKSMAEPTPVLFPIEVVSSISKPVSLACRLFGNMLGGMIVIDLLYMAMGNFGGGIPGVVGLYFNVFHPIIQAYIFVTLSLTFIREAVE